MLLTKKDLWRMRVNTTSQLEAEVLDIILDEVDTDEDVNKYLDNVLVYGANTGCVSSLTYTSDCREFVKRHIDEVLEIYNEIIAESGDIPNELDVNYLAWLAFESICSLIKNNENIEDFVL